jgi:protoporphyrinogen oxidase
MHFLIIGSGLSGLSTGVGLLQAGHKVTLLEKTNVVGGLARTFREDGFIFDIGPHIFFGRRLVPKLKEILGGDINILFNNNLKEAIYFDRTFFKYPFQPRDLALKMKRTRLLKALWELFVRNMWSSRAHNHSENLYDWATSKVGPTLFYYTGLDTYIEKLYGISSTEVASDWGKQRLKPLIRFNLWKSLLKNMNPLAREQRVHTYYCPEGIGEVADSLCRYLRRNGGVIRLNAAVKEIEVWNDSVKSIALEEGNSLSSLTGDCVLSTVRIVDLIAMIRPEPPGEVLSATDTLKYRNLILLYLIVNRPLVLKNCLVYIAERDTTFKRITEFKYFTDKAAPEHKTSLCIEISCDSEDDIWKESDEIVFQKTVKELEKLNIVTGLDLEKYFVKRVLNAYPVYHLDYQKPLKEILEYLAGIKNLISMGRQGLYQHDNMSASIRAGLELSDMLKDRESKNFGAIGKKVYRSRLNKYASVI